MKEFTFKTYHAGARAYFDTLFSGLVPCKVFAVYSNRVEAIVTKEVKSYKKGQVVSSPKYLMVPKERVFTRKGFYTINTQFNWA